MRFSKLALLSTCAAVCVNHGIAEPARPRHTFLPSSPTEEERAQVRTDLRGGALGAILAAAGLFMTGRVRHDIYNLLEDLHEYELTQSAEMRKKILSPKFQRYIKCRQRRLRIVQVVDVVSYGITCGVIIGTAPLPVAFMILAPATAIITVKAGEDQNAYKILSSYKKKQFKKKAHKPVLRCTRGVTAASAGYNYISAINAAQTAITLFDAARFV